MERLNIYRNKKVLVTGHTGFKGSWLSLWLSQLGAKVIGYALKPETEPNLFDTLSLKNTVSHHIGDVRDLAKLNKVVKASKPDMVIHMAAQPLVRRSYLEPKYTYEVNVLGTVNVLEAVRQSNTIKSVLIVTSDKCYENKEQVIGYTETDSMGGYDPYSSSKGCAELVTAAYTKSFFNPAKYKSHKIAVASVRAGNVIGGGDWAEDRLVPDCIKSLAMNKTIVIRNPYAIRPWQYVLEPLYGYLLLGSQLLRGHAKFIGGWNFGPKDKNIVNVGTIVKKVLGLWGNGAYKISGDKALHEANILKLNINKAVNLLKWQPKININQALAKTVQWYKEFYTKKTDMRRVSIQQIRDYMGDL